MSTSNYISIITTTTIKTTNNVSSDDYPHTRF